MLTWMDVLEQEERRRERLAEAEQYRLARQLPRPERRPSIRFHYRLLTSLGHRLEQWGCELQTRYQPEPLLSGSASGGCGS